MHDHWLEFSKIALAHLLAVASPGPDFAIVLKQSLRHGRRAAMWTSLGIGTGIALHASYSLLGLGLVLRNSSQWFDVVKFAGAAYLAWLGVQALRSKPRPAAENTAPTMFAPPADRGAFVTGLLTNALNPKATLFIVSLFAVVVSPATPRWLQAGYAVWLSLATMAWFCFVSVVFTRADVRAKFLRHGHWIDRALGVVFLAFAAGLALTRFR